MVTCGPQPLTIGYYTDGFRQLPNQLVILSTGPDQHPNPAHDMKCLLTLMQFAGVGFWF